MGIEKILIFGEGEGRWWNFCGLISNMVQHKENLGFIVVGIWRFGEEQ